MKKILFIFYVFTVV